jgi:hypothetical protein
VWFIFVKSWHCKYKYRANLAHQDDIAGERGEEPCTRELKDRLPLQFLCSLGVRTVQFFLHRISEIEYYTLSKDKIDFNN